VLENIKDQFFGDAQRGVYSPSVQATLYDMGNAIVNNIREVKDVKFTLPNIHFIPISPNGADHKFDDDVYVATSEPHGTIVATVSKRNETPEIRSRL
jgi:urate oxidase